jgi:aspartyl-tRNA(Asn)/glutamyl-tRNA(Gln) amidotransferase subunit C
MLAFAVPSEFSRQQVAAIAELANLELNAAESDLFARQLAEILAYAQEIQRADTTGVPPTSAVMTASGVEREDAVRPSLDVRDALANAPDAAAAAGLFRVPRIIG